VDHGDLCGALSGARTQAAHVGAQRSHRTNLPVGEHCSHILSFTVGCYFLNCIPFLFPFLKIFPLAAAFAVCMCFRLIEVSAEELLSEEFSAGESEDLSAGEAEDYSGDEMERGDKSVLLDEAVKALSSQAGLTEEEYLPSLPNPNQGGATNSVQLLEEGNPFTDVPLSGEQHIKGSPSGNSANSEGVAPAARDSFGR